MAAAQRKRWRALKAQQQADAKKTKPKVAVMRRKATITTAKAKHTAPAKAAKKIAMKVVVKAVSRPVAKAVAPRPKKNPAEAPKAVVEMPAAPAEVAVEPAPATEYA